MFFGLRRGLRPVVRVGLGIADRLGQHLAQFGLRLCRLSREGFLPVRHHHYVGMPREELNPSGTERNRQQQAIRRRAASP